ncbi:MAG: T9SS type A sorting domain-containing protein [Tannerella sp.]|jgi:hypothetical protein|nr:T9SS type A sorting domain-containing protein [Tannerella sp.]
MKSKIVRAGFILLSCLFFTVNTTMSGNLYVYKTDGFKLTFSTADLQKVEFLSDALAVYPKSGEETIIPYADLQYFTLKDPSTTGLSEVTAASFDVYPNPAVDILTVTSAQAITGLELSDLQGRQLQKLQPAGVLKVDVSLTAYPAGVYLLRIIDETGSVTVRKIIKK